MPRIPIRIYPDPILKQKTEDVKNFDQKLHAMLDDMGETMYAAKGIGLAANQVGILGRIAVIDVSEEHNEKIDLVNPQIVWTQGKVSSEEGCLSIPEYRDTIQRSKEIVVQAFDRFGKELEIKTDGLLAICIQHEVDHLDGVLFVDHLSRLKRELFRRWLKKRDSDGEE